MEWSTEEFGESHEGIAGAVLADGSEPKAVYLDFGSGADSGHWTREWWAYNGSMSRPRAAAYRGACACGWRGTSYPIDGERMTDERLYDLDTTQAYRDWKEHIRAVERQTVPLPDELTMLLGKLEEQLKALSEQAPVAALKAVAALERLTEDVAQDAAYAVHEDELPWETVGRALGLSPGAARDRLNRYLLR